MQFPKDIFISYAHIDDESLIENQKGWITEFHRALEIRLAQLLGRRPVIWRDPALQGNHIFDRQIVEQFEQVAIMISIITPRYVKSEWCIREATEFFDSCNNNIGFSINNQARIFKVIKTPVKLEQHPEQIRNILGYDFFITDPITGRQKELMTGFGNQSEKLYWEKLDDLANDVSGFLDSLEYIEAGKKSATGADLSSTTRNESLRIYLAESSYETKEFRDSIRRELQDSGYQILPDKQLPLIGPALIEDVSGFLSHADLAVHIIGENYGIVPEGTQQSIVELQNEVASAASSATGLPRLIWMPQGFYPKEERQQFFLNKLNDGQQGTVGADLVFSALEDFKSIMSDQIAAIEKARKKRREEEQRAAESKMSVVQSGNELPAISKGSGVIYLICDILDLDDIKPIEDYLFDQGFEVVIPIFEGDETLIREDHLENLKICDAAIIFYGNANEIWLRSKTREFLKIAGYGRETPLAVKGIYISGPPSPSKERFRSQDAEVINGTNGLPTEKIQSLLSKL